MESTILVGGGVPELCGNQLFWGLQISPKSILAPQHLSIAQIIYPLDYISGENMLLMLRCSPPEDGLLPGWMVQRRNCVVNSHMYDVSEFGHHRDFKLEACFERNPEVLGGW